MSFWEEIVYSTPTRILPDIPLVNKYTDTIKLKYACARRSSVEVAEWTVDREIRVRFPSHPHYSDGMKVSDVFGRPGPVSR